MKPIRILSAGAMFSLIGYLGCELYDIVQERNTDTANPVTPEMSTEDSSLPSLEQAVYDHLVDIGTDKNGFPTPLRTWGKTIDEIGQENLRAYVDSVVALTSDACNTYAFPSDVDCGPFMLSLFLQESQLYPYATSSHAAGIAQLGVETALEQELQLPQGLKYNAWMQAREKGLGKSAENNARRSYTKAISTIAQTKHSQNIEYELPALDERYNIECAIPAATAVVSVLLGKYHGNTEPALHAYNFGERNLKKAQDSGQELPNETQIHAKRIVTFYENLRVSTF